MWLWLVQKIPLAMLLRLVAQLRLGATLWGIVVRVVGDVESEFSELPGREKFLLALNRVLSELRRQGLGWTDNLLNWAIEQAVAVKKTAGA